MTTTKIELSQAVVHETDGVKRVCMGCTLGRITDNLTAADAPVVAKNAASALTLAAFFAAARDAAPDTTAEGKVLESVSDVVAQYINHTIETSAAELRKALGFGQSLAFAINMSTVVESMPKLLALCLSTQRKIDAGQAVEVTVERD